MRAVLAATAASAVLVSGCATTSENLGISPTVAQACLAGAGAGALIGALISDENRGRNALIGAAAGAAVGCTAGGILNQRRQQYADTAQFYDAQIALTQQTNAELAQINAQTRTEVAAYRTEIDRLASLEAASQADRDSARQQLAAIQETQRLTERRIEVIEREIEVQDAALALPDAPAQGTEDYDQLAAEVSEMRTYVEELRDYAETLAGQQEAIGQFI